MKVVHRIYVSYIHKRLFLITGVFQKITNRYICYLYALVEMILGGFNEKFSYSINGISSI